MTLTAAQQKQHDQLNQKGEAVRNRITQYRAGCLNLRQWASNDSRLLEGLPSGNINLQLHNQHDNTIKTLGVHWNSENDSIVYTVQPPPRDDRVTKRTILSHIARIFDPLGLLGPIVTHAKLILQRLWLERIDWDESLPADVHTEWLTYASQLKLINNLQFRRWITENNANDIQLHGFCDASERAYGACIYMRTSDEEGKISTTLLCAKSRVAPLKGKQTNNEGKSDITIPKLELCGAALLAKLYTVVTQAMTIKIRKTVLWCDNTAVIHWINTSPSKLMPFVSNRVSFIQENTAMDSWRYIRSGDNPADLISRGQLPSVYLLDAKWKNGPAWLSSEESTWPPPGIPTTDINLGLRKFKCLMVPLKSDILTRYSSITKLRRFVALALRFKISSKQTGLITHEELHHSNMKIVKLVQAAVFHDELQDLQEQKTINAKSKLITLAPFLDDNGIIRVGGRITNSKLPFAEKHPMILPPSHHVTTLIIRHCHLANYHAGVQSTLYTLRKLYWIIDGKNQVRKVIRSCMTCSRIKPPDTAYIMGNLPAVRVQEARPFLNVGVDYCGPFYIKEKRHRNRGKEKVYVAIFVCLVVKAVHFELVSDLTTEAFLATLKRFIARRGKCEQIYSDNGTNFVGANNEMKKIINHLQSENLRTQVFDFCANHGIQWHFIPPQSPNFGGIWEAAVKSCKHHMRRVIGEQLFTYEVFYTFLTEIEAILNSRPLTPLSSDPNDPLALTPGHFLIGNALTSLPEVSLQNVSTNRLSMWQHIQKMRQHFWKRWHKEYLHQLNIRHKWSRGSHDVREGSLVLLKEDNTPPLRWLMGRVVETRPGSDGIIRVATVKTSRGVVERNIRNLAPLPVSTTAEASTDGHSNDTAD